MVLNGKRISIVMLVLVGFLGMSSLRLAQSRRNVNVAVQRFVEPADPARDLFNTGQKFFDQNRHADAERTFREVIEKYPKNAIVDRAEYYLIRTLTQTGRRAEALERINAFAKKYPKSTWQPDVEELKMGLTNQVSPQAFD